MSRWKYGKSARWNFLSWKMSNDWVNLRVEESIWIGLQSLLECNNKRKSSHQRGDYANFISWRVFLVSSNCCCSTFNSYNSVNKWLDIQHSNHVLGVKDATWEHGWGWPQSHLVICLAIAWIIAFLCVIKGVQSVGKIVYFTATFPYFILTALLIRALTLDGSISGMKYYISPQFDRLLSAGLWGDSSSQIFYSFGLGCGSLVTFASFNKFKNNLHFDAVFVSIVNFLTAVFAGFVVFGGCEVNYFRLTIWAFWQHLNVLYILQRYWVFYRKTWASQFQTWRARDRAWLLWLSRRQFYWCHSHKFGPSCSSSWCSSSVWDRNLAEFKWFPPPSSISGLIYVNTSRESLRALASHVSS